MRKQSTDELEIRIKFFHSIFVNLDGTHDYQNVVCYSLCFTESAYCVLTAILCDTRFSHVVEENVGEKQNVGTLTQFPLRNPSAGYQLVTCG